MHTPLCLSTTAMQSAQVAALLNGDGFEFTEQIAEADLRNWRRRGQRAHHPPAHYSQTWRMQG